MKRTLVFVAGSLVLFVAGYFLGTAAGLSAGVVKGTAIADWEWARMLEDGVVGPLQTSRPVPLPDLVHIGD